MKPSLKVVRSIKPTPAQAIERRGYVQQYHEDIVNHCPGCGRSHWYIGRAMAECAVCETALPLSRTGRFCNARIR